MADPEFAWTQDSWDVEGDVRDRPASRKNERLAWFGVIALAMIAFEFTADPAITSSLGCLKFGWDEVRLARWLKRSDPDRKRGRICGRFYLAWGLWRISLVAAGLMLIITFAHAAIEGRPARGAGPAEPPPGVLGCVLTMLIGFLLSSAVSTFAVFSALRHRVRVWVGPEVRWAREDETWPPQNARRRRETINWARVILLSALITASVFGLMAVVIPLSYAIPGEIKSRITPVAVMMVFILGVPFLILVLLERLGSMMIARSPADCWTESREVEHRPSRRIAPRSRPAGE